jgi:ATP-dependent helicase HrpA
VVLATNVAETSLTVPGIRYVIDSGTARISRYSYRAKVQRLPIEAISGQRQPAQGPLRPGRAGHLRAPVQRRRFQRPAGIHRPGDPAHQPGGGDPADAAPAPGRHQTFPFIEPPDGKAISDGFNLLQELSAVDRNNQLTPLGRQLARLPVDPRWAACCSKAPPAACRKC